MSEAESLLNPPSDKWKSSAESIAMQKVTKLTKSESVFPVTQGFSSDVTFTELELWEINVEDLKPKEKWDLVKDNTRFSRILQTRSLLRDELEILKINMSLHDKAVNLRVSQFLKAYQSESKRKKAEKYFKYLGKSRRMFHKFVPGKLKDLITEIEGSESAKRDNKIWNFLKRGSSLRKEILATRQFFMEIQSWRISEFQNTQPFRLTCPNCTFFIVTNIKTVSSLRNKLATVVLAVFGLCFFPHVLFNFKDTVHLCPLCKIYLGFCPALGMRSRKRQWWLNEHKQSKTSKDKEIDITDQKKMVSASSTSAKNLFVESKLRLSDRVQVNVNNISAVARQIQRGSKANENLIAAAKNFALQEPAIDNSETNLKKLMLLTTHINSQLDSLQNSSGKMEMVLEQVRSMQR